MRIVWIALIGLTGCQATQPRVVPPPDHPPLFGMALGLHPEASQTYDLEYPPHTAPIKALGARAVLLPVRWRQDNVASIHVGPGPDTPTFDDLNVVVDRAHRDGLAVAVMPFVNLVDAGPDEWRGVLAPEDPKAWWQNYTARMLEVAAWADQRQIAVLVIGSELTSLSRDPDPWRTLATAVRAKYRGPLAVVANHDALDRVAPFAFVDLAGVSAYFSLTSNLEASPAELTDGWSHNLRQLRAFQDAVHRPVVLFEVGYPSIDGAAVRPWRYTAGAPIDLHEQYLAYVAATDAIRSADWIHGVFFWTWFGPGGRYDRHYTPKGKPAEDALRQFFREVTSR